MYEHRRQVPKIIFTRPKSPGLGHLALKSSVFAPTAMSFMGQDYVFNHMKSHYHRIASAKAAIDTTPPRALTSNIKAQDKKRREKLKNGSNSATTTPHPGTSRSVKSEQFTQEGFSPNNTEVEDEELGRSASRNTLNLEDSWLDVRTSRTHEAAGRDSRFSRRQERLQREMNDSRDGEGEYRAASARYTADDTRMSPGYSDRRLVHSQQSNYTSTPRSPLRTSRKDPHLVIWENDQKYLRFIQEVTADVLARGIFTDRVLNKVFEGHIEKNRNELDEGRMQEMIDQLKIDLGMGNDS